MSAEEALNHPWLNVESLKSAPVGEEELGHVSNNLVEFLGASTFSKMIISVLSALKVQ